jgi:hypothetical protein
MEYLREWVKNLAVNFGIVIGIIVFMIIFMKIFYPDALSVIFLTGEFAIGMINVLKIWPIVILAVIVYSMPRRKRRR